MDALSAAASIIAVIEISGKLFATCRTYYLSVKDARTDITRLKNELTTLEAVLTNIVDLVELSDTGLAIVNLLNERDGPIMESKAILGQIIAKLETGEAESSMKRFGLRALKWPFTSKELDHAIEILQRNKSLFSIAMLGDILSLNLAFKSGIEEMKGKLHDTHDLVALTQEEVGATRKYLETKEALERVHKEADKRNKIMTWLIKADPLSNHQAACQKHEPGTGKWVLEREEFKDWEVGENSILWVHGIAGSGKTIISSTIIEHAKLRCDKGPSAVLAFFYFDFSNPTKQNVVNCLASLVAQLCNQSTDIPEELRDMYTEHEPMKTLPSLFDLRRIFNILISKRTIQDVFLVLDALDECPKGGEGEREKLLQLIKGIHTSSSSKVHLLVTSRELNDIQQVLLPMIGTSRISIQESNSKEDIEAFVSSQLLHDPLLSVWPDGVKAEIKKVLSDTTDGMFRWAYCQLQTIRKFKQKRPLLKALGSLPKTLNETYDRMIQEIDLEDQDLSRRALLWLAFADQALTVGELAEAMILDPTAANCFDFEDRLHSPYNDVLEILGSLITIIPHDIDEEEAMDDLQKVVKLAHFSVKEYILSNKDKNSTLHMTPAAAQVFCTRTCLSYILHWNDSSSRTMSIRDRTEFPFLGYACSSWVGHALQIPQRDREVLDDELDRLFLTESTFWDWLKVDDPCGTTCWNFDGDKEHCKPLFYAAYFGLTSIVSKLLDKNADPVESYGRKLRTPLHVAAWSDDGSITKLLLDRSIALIEMENQHGYTALQYAAMSNNHAVVSSLLRYHANLDSAGGCGDGVTALMYAAARDYVEVVKILLSAGADVDRSDDEGRSALSWAAWCDCEAAFRLLVNAGASIEAREMDGKTLLHRASESGSTVIARLLLDLGADVLAVDQEGKPPLHYSRNTQMIDLLLLHGAEVNGLDCNERSCLHAVSERGQAKIIQYLIENGATLQIVDRFGQTPLHAAIPNTGPDSYFPSKNKLRVPPYRNVRSYRTVEDGRPVYESISPREVADTVRVLVTQSADIVDQKDRNSQTALHICADPLVAEVLIETGASLDCQDERDMTPLIRAAGEANLELLDLLLRYKQDVQLCDSTGDTALHYLVRSPFNLMVNAEQNCSEWISSFHRLLNHGVNLEAKNAMGETALILWVASDIPDWVPKSEVIRAFLEKGADVGVQSLDGKTVLHHACSNRYSDLETVKFFLKNGGSLESRDANGRTPLHLAAVHSASPHLYQMLLELGADANAIDNEGNTLIDYVNKAKDERRIYYNGKKGVFEDWNSNDK